MFVLNQCCCYFLPEFLILFASGFKWLIMFRMTSLSSTYPWFVSFVCSLSLYSSCISLMLSSIYWFPHPLYASNSSANMHWTWYAQSSMLLWIRYCRSSNIPRMFIVFSSYPILVSVHLSSSPILSTFCNIVWSNHLVLPWMLWLHPCCSISW